MPSSAQKEAAALCMEHLVDHDWHGYTWGDRWGDGEGTCSIETPIGTCYVEQGDRDCSSGVISSYEAAGISCGGATYTGNMVDCMTGTGNFRAHWMSNGDDCDDGYIAQRGDCYVNTTHHTAMCISAVPDMLAEFSSNEFGGCYGGQVGDQTGYESHRGAYYAYPWNVVLECVVDDSPAPAPSGGGVPSSSRNGKLYGIDVSSNQPAGIVSMVPNDFAIVKVSGNPQYDSSGRPLDWDYINPYAAQQAGDAMRKHGRLGLYHFTYGKDARTEADFFIDQVERLGYIGEAMLVIDYEGQALDCGPDWVRRFAERITERAGYPPVIYASGSVINGQGLFGLGYPIWCANYYQGYTPIYGYDDSGCAIFDGCEDSILWQYTSQGFLDGYGGALDCNVFYGNDEDWKKFTGNEEDIVTPEDKREIAEMASDMAAQKTLWGWNTIDGVDGVTLMGLVKNMVHDVWHYPIEDVPAMFRLFGIDCTVNAYERAILDAVEKIAVANGLDGKKVAEQVAAEVANKLEQISLDVTVKE